MKDEQPNEATSFNPNDAPLSKRLDGTESRRGHYRRLKQKNMSGGNGQWRDRRQETEDNAAAIVDSVAGQLELTDYQHTEARRIFNNLPESFNQAYSTAKLAFAVCAVVGWHDGRNYHPNNIHDDHFGSARQEYGLGNGIYASLWYRVEEEVDL